MNMPGFTAEVSVYRTSKYSHMAAAFGQAGGTAIYRIQPQTIWPGPIWPADPCARLWGCARIRCECIMAGGYPETVRITPQTPCGFVCT